MPVRVAPRGFATRVAEIEPFRVVEVLQRATQMADAGVDIVHRAAPPSRAAPRTTPRPRAFRNCARHFRSITPTPTGWISRQRASW